MTDRWEIIDGCGSNCEELTKVTVEDMMTNFRISKLKRLLK